VGQQAYEELLKERTLRPFARKPHTSHPGYASFNRIIRIEENTDSIAIRPPTFTFRAASPKRFATLTRGELEIHYDEEGYFALVEWRRES
jgi:hypothetical protein